ncbi:MAG: PEP/pyruvate-binding domain-containing protein [Mariprofundus sp.]
MLLWLSLIAAPITSYAADAVNAINPAQLVEQMKQHRRGPFLNIRWFCHDGSVLPPGEYVCRAHGGGKQHGQWSAATRTLRAQGYLLANVLAELAPEDFTGAAPQLHALKQILLERYLISADDGWVFRRARFYRGALQAEDEQHAARAMVVAMLADPEWLQTGRFLLLREAVRLLPVTLASELTRTVRQAATDLAVPDPGFRRLRTKIHGQPDAGDAAAVRAYARQYGLSTLQPDYERLAEQLEALYSPQICQLQLQHLAGESNNRVFKREIANAVKKLHRARDPAAGIAVAAAMMQSWQRTLYSDKRYTVYNRLRLLRASLLLEEQIYVLGNQLLIGAKTASRQTRLTWLVHLGRSLQAAGLVPATLWQAAEAQLIELAQQQTVSAAHYQRTLAYLARVSQWAQRAMAFHFTETVEQWGRLTPLAANYIPDRLRSSPLLPFTRLLDSLMLDAQAQTGISHRIFALHVAGGLRALNPGISRGILLEQPSDPAQMRADGIYLLQSTLHTLPPVAGIITRGEGSSLSHVQLLARNMGIPNVVAADHVLSLIHRHIGQSVEMAVSPGGIIAITGAETQLALSNNPEWMHSDIRIDADLSRLHLQDVRLRSLGELRAGDAGRSVGPKAANLAELMHFYPQQVSPGVVIPFAQFRNHLRQPLYKGGPAVFDWMSAEYSRLRAIPDSSTRHRQEHLFLSRLRDWLLHSRIAPALRRQLQLKLADTFGPDGSYGVFVRSDTNVEDLPGFSGAGLNLTVANVVGFEAIVDALLRVWASPFTKRAYAWRQSHMQQPQHVYPAVLLMKSVPSEISGVMVTRDVDTGDRAWLSVAVNEGVGGAVDGQAAEELRVRRSSGQTRLLSVATAPKRAALSADGGMLRLPASGQGRLLKRGEISQLRVLAADVDHRFPLPRQTDGRPVAADIEFGFVGGQLTLFQIRPFVESKRAAISERLQTMDAQLPDISAIKIDLAQAPRP